MALIATSRWSARGLCGDVNAKNRPGDEERKRFCLLTAKSQQRIGVGDGSLEAIDLFACKNPRTIVDVRADQWFAENVERSHNLLFKTRCFGKMVHDKNHDLASFSRCN